MVHVPIEGQGTAGSAVDGSLGQQGGRSTTMHLIVQEHQKGHRDSQEHMPASC